MQIGYGAGALVTILLPFVFLFLGITSILQTLFLVFLLYGLWTLVATFTMVKKAERNYYLSWGLILTGASSFFVTSFAYAIAIVLVLIIVSILITYTRRGPKIASKA